MSPKFILKIKSDKRPQFQKRYKKFKYFYIWRSTVMASGAIAPFLPPPLDPALNLLPIYAIVYKSILVPNEYFYFIFKILI